MSNLAYIRVSTKEQNTERQHEILKKYKIDKVFEEKASGKDTNRPQLIAMLEYIRENDIVYIESYSRLARSVSDLLAIVNKIKEKKAALVSIKENFDTSTPQGNLQMNIFASIYEFERECIRERQREGIDICLADGRAYGRPKKYVIDENFVKIYRQWKHGDFTAVQAFKTLDMKKATFYKLVKEYEDMHSL